MRLFRIWKQSVRRAPPFARRLRPLSWEHRKRDIGMTQSTKTPIALITGGSRGLGKSMALHLAQRGVDVVITFREKEAEAAEVVRAVTEAGGKAAALRLDVGDSRTFDAFAGALRDELASTFGAERFDY